MERGKLKLVFFYLLLLISWVFIYPLTVGSQPKTTLPTKDDFPSNENLGERNVGLLMVGFEFGSGLSLNAQGQPNCDGTELLEAGKYGSGFIVSEDGTIVTNYHVAVRTLRGEAKFQDGSTYQIRNIKKYDPVNDIAILKISGQRAFPKVDLGDSDRVEVRDKVLAVGNPRGRGINITEGTVSQVLRDDYNKVVLITHTATITFGNSGGALYKGSKVIGINTSGGEGFNHAVPINKATGLLPTQNLFPLGSVFPKNHALIGQKARLLDAMNGQVPAAQGQNPGRSVFVYTTYALEDLLFIVRSPGKDLAIKVFDSTGRTIGLGDLRGPNLEALLITSKSNQEIGIAVLNYDSEPANFGLEVKKIVW